MDAQPWDRMNGEPLIWYRRFTALRLMSPTRSVAAVYQAEETTKNHEKPRTKPPGDWYQIADAWQWDKRCAAFDDHQTKELEAQVAAEKSKILKSGFALVHKRVQLLNALTIKLAAMTGEDKNIWLKDVKSIGTGKDAYQVDLVRFNADLFTVIDKYLASIAAEMGERVKTTKQEITGKDGKPLLPGHDELLSAMTDAEFELLKQLQTQALARVEQQHGDSTEENH